MEPLTGPPTDQDYGIYFAHLHFLPTKALRFVTFESGLFHAPMAAIESYDWSQHKKLKTLEFSGFNPRLFSQPMLTRWPSSLTELCLRMDEVEWVDPNPADIHLPETLLVLEIADGMFEYSTPNLLRLPPHLTDLTYFPQHALREWSLPSSLQRLILGESFNFSVDHWRLPSALSNLYGRIRSTLQHVVFNEQLTRLSFEEFNQDLPGVQFPASLTHLDLGDEFSRPLMGVICPRI